jgi:hypothetical protein
MIVVKARPDIEQAYLYTTLVMRGLPDADFRLIWPKERKADLEDDSMPAFKRRLPVEHVELLHRNNAAGYGVFMTPQETDGRGVKNSNVVRILTIVADLDLKKTKAKKPAFPLAPSFEVESSPGNFNVYWLVDPDGPVSFEQHADIMARLVHSYGADPATMDGSHIFRVPGFFHTKGKPVMSRLHLPPRITQHTADELIAAFPKLKTSEKATRQPQAPTAYSGPLSLRRVEELLAVIPVDKGQPGGERYMHWLRVGAALHHATGGSDKGFELWRAWSESSHAYDLAELQAKWPTFADREGKREAGTPGGRATAGTLYHLAREHGWKPKGLCEIFVSSEQARSIQEGWGQ